MASKGLSGYYEVAETKQGYGTYYYAIFSDGNTYKKGDKILVSEEWVLCKDDAESHVDAVGAAESADCLLELKFKEAVRKITLDDLKRILLKKIEDSIKNMSDDVIQDILAEALG